MFNKFLGIIALFTVLLELVKEVAAALVLLCVEVVVAISRFIKEILAALFSIYSIPRLTL